ncbi:MAG: hypothetical protein R2828_35835 [Saprospiraceae bacterium]
MTVLHEMVFMSQIVLLDQRLRSGLLNVCEAANDNFDNIEVWCSIQSILTAREMSLRCFGLVLSFSRVSLLNVKFAMKESAISRFGVKKQSATKSPHKKLFELRNNQTQL